MSDQKSESSAKEFVCSTAGCGKSPSTLSCPTCVELSLPASYFCSQECFKGYWKEHNIVHKYERERRSYKPYEFDYTGPLRPHWVSPMRIVPPHIPRPEYADSGTPTTEVKLRGNTAIYVNTKKEIDGIRSACRVARQVLDYARSLVRPGITTEEIDAAVHSKTVELNAYPSPLNYHFFPKSCCTSINEVICHGIPDARKLQEGDIVNVDITCYYKGYHGDINETYPVGNIDEKAKLLIKTTYEAMDNAIKAVRPGTMCREFGNIISKHVNKVGFSVVRTYSGHGVGALFHTTPNIPHYSNNKAVGVLKPGMVFTIEPMINEGVWKDVTWPDSWTATTADGKRSAQFEHTVLVTENGYEVLTARTKDSPPFFWEVDDKKGGDEKEEKNSKGGRAENGSDEKTETKTTAPTYTVSPSDGADGDGDKKKKKKKKKKNKGQGEGTSTGGEAGKHDDDGEDDGDAGES